MKTRILLVLLIVTLGAALWNFTGLPGRTAKPWIDPAITANHPLSKIALGMSREQVIAQLGEPTLKSKTSWMYDGRGYVRFHNDAVVTLIVR